MISSHRSWFLLVILLATPLLVAGPTLAQSPDGVQGQGQGQWGGHGGQHGQMSPDDRLKQMTADLNLTADEQSKIKPILEDQQKQMDDARSNNSGGDWQATRQKMDQIRTDTNSKIRAILDDKQRAKFDQEEADREQRMQHRGGMGGPGGGPGSGPGNAPNNAPNNGPGSGGSGNTPNNPPPGMN
jgi:Spy/CpxP family protein refolding chaperone